jgi:hypothetical protein
MEITYKSLEERKKASLEALEETKEILNKEEKQYLRKILKEKRKVIIMLTKAKSISFKNIKDSDYYKITNIILNQKEPFTINDIKKEINLKITSNKKNFLIKRALNKLGNNGMIIKHGSYFSRTKL